MEYNYDEMFKEVMNRRNSIQRRRERRIDIALTVISVLMVVFMVSALLMQPRMTTTVQTPTTYGALMVSSSNGVFVLVAVAAFILGIAVTLLSGRRQKRNKDKGTEQVE